jgi:hypothetical protein
MARQSPNFMEQRAHPKGSLDYFPTPPWATRALIHEVLIPAGVTVGTMGAELSRQFLCPKVRRTDPGQKLSIARRG